jgi:hypothetical protein
MMSRSFSYVSRRVVRQTKIRAGLLVPVIATSWWIVAAAEGGGNQIGVVTS